MTIICKIGWRERDLNCSVEMQRAHLGHGSREAGQMVERVGPQSKTAVASIPAPQLATLWDAGQILHFAVTQLNPC